MRNVGTLLAVASCILVSCLCACQRQPVPSAISATDVGGQGRLAPPPSPAPAPAPASAFAARRIIFVDCQLKADCLHGEYSIAARGASGSDGIAYATIQKAADFVQPCDVVRIRGGKYIHEGAKRVFVEIARGGTKESPVVFGAFRDERPVLWGRGFEDRDKNGDGLADGPATQETLMQIRQGANYVQLQGMEFANGGEGVDVGGEHCLVENCVAHDNWMAGIVIMRGEHNTIRLCEAYNNRHHSGIRLGGYFLGHDPNYNVGHAVIEDCLSHDNGKEPGGAPVLPTGGDPQGGGNADGIGSSKSLHDNGGPNLGQDMLVRRCIVFGNADDGFDFSSEGLVRDCIAFSNGPHHDDTPATAKVGHLSYKVLRQVNNLSYMGCVAYDDSPGFETARVPSGQKFYHNTAVGCTRGSIDAMPSADMANNLGAFNGKDGTNRAAGGRNWLMDGLHGEKRLSGDPVLTNHAPVIDTKFPPGLTVEGKLDFIRGQFRRAFTPAPGSPLIDAGKLIEGFHCPRADDDPANPMPPDAPGRHWCGKAPDIGAFEYVPAQK